MALYDYQCSKCSFTDEYSHSMKESPELSCPECGTTMERLISFNKNSFVIKGATEAKTWKEERYRLKRSAQVGVKQVERWGSGPKLKPNVAGVETESWSDAAKLAKEAGINSTSYAPLIEKEKNVSKVSGVSDSAWKAAKEKV